MSPMSSHRVDAAYCITADRLLPGGASYHFYLTSSCIPTGCLLYPHRGTSLSPSRSLQTRPSGIFVFSFFWLVLLKPLDLLFEPALQDLASPAFLPLLRIPLRLRRFQLPDSVWASFAQPQTHACRSSPLCSSSSCCTPAPTATPL